jgi:hypothetical protein
MFRVVLLISLIVAFQANARSQESDASANPADFLEVSEAEKVCLLNDDRLSEGSGLAASRTHQGFVWSHNDGGHASELFLLNASSGKIVANCLLEKVRQVDWEDMASFEWDEKQWLVIADVGDNLRSRKTCQLLFVLEPEFREDELHRPTAAKRSLKVEYTIDFSYEDGPRDCESVAVDVAGKSIWLASKASIARDRTRPETAAGAYRLDLDFAKTSQTATRVAQLDDPLITGMDISPNGKIAIVRNYTYASAYRRNENESWTDAFKKGKPQQFGLPTQLQGEAICFAADSDSIWLSSEFVEQPLWKIKVALKN